MVPSGLGRSGAPHISLGEVCSLGQIPASFSANPQSPAEKTVAAAGPRHSNPPTGRLSRRSAYLCLARSLLLLRANRQSMEGFQRKPGCAALNAKRPRIHTTQTSIILSPSDCSYYQTPIDAVGFPPQNDRHAGWYSGCSRPRITHAGRLAQQQPRHLAYSARKPLDMGNIIEIHTCRQSDPALGRGLGGATSDRPGQTTWTRPRSSFSRNGLPSMIVPPSSFDPPRKPLTPLPG